MEDFEELLLQSARNGDASTVADLLQARQKSRINFNINCKGRSKSNYSWTPLHLACYFGHLKVASVLLENDAEVNVQNDAGDTPLHKASLTGRENLVLLLLQHNADVLSINGEGQTPKDLALVQEVRKILDGVEKSETRKKEATFLQAAREGNLDVLNSLLKGPIPTNINCVDTSGNTALHCAAYREQTEVAVILLQNGIDSSISNRQGQVALDLARSAEMKQILDVMPIRALSKSAARFEGSLLKRSRFLGWKEIWAVLDRGVLTYFKTRADACAGGKRRGYKILDGAKIYPLEIESSGFIIHFSDNTIHRLCLLPNSDENGIGLHKWISTLKEHVDYCAYLLRSDSKEDRFGDEPEVMPLGSMEDVLKDSKVHHDVLEDHLAALYELANDKPRNGLAEVYQKLDQLNDVAKTMIGSLGHCLSILKQQEEVRQLQLKQEKEKRRLLEHAFHVLVKDHRDLEQSVNSISVFHSPSSPRSPFGDTSEEDDEFYDAYEGASENRATPFADDNLVPLSSECLIQHLISAAGRELSIRQVTDSDPLAVDEPRLFNPPTSEVEGLVPEIQPSNISEGFVTRKTSATSVAISLADDPMNGSVQMSIDSAVKPLQLTSNTCDEMLSTNKFRNPSHTPPNLSPKSNAALSSFHLLLHPSRIMARSQNSSGSAFSPDFVPPSTAVYIMQESFDDDPLGNPGTSKKKSTTRTVPSKSSEGQEKRRQPGISDGPSDSDDPSSPGTSARKWKPRKRLPVKMKPRNDFSVWSVLKQAIGKELSKITMPIIFNEPLSFLQRISEYMEYGNLLNKAGKEKDPITRMEYVAAFAVSALASNWGRVGKPFNPLLGETYELERDGYRLVCEQVSHHPPISAFHADSPHFVFHGAILPKLKFWGKSIEIQPKGVITVELPKFGDVYTWNNVNCCIHNIIVGQLWIEQYGSMELVNHKNGQKCVLNFKPAGWFSKDLHKVEGFIYDKNKKKVRFLYGKWTDLLKSSDMKSYEDYNKSHPHRSKPSAPAEPPEANGFEGGSAPPKSESTLSIDIPHSVTLWEAAPRPSYSSDYYEFSLFAMSLNQMEEGMESSLAPTDSRRRPDIRLLEEGSIDSASNTKTRVEEKQRESRKSRKVTAKDHWAPIWFKPLKNPYTREEDWEYVADYWSRDFSRSPDIF